MKKISLDKTVTEFHKSITFNTPKDAYIQIVEALREFWGMNAEVVSAEVFAPWSFGEVIAPLTNANFPLNWICPLQDNAKPFLAGIHFVGVSGTKVKFLKSKHGAKASVYEDSSSIYCRTFGVLGAANNDDGYVHTHSNLDELESVLKMCGFEYTDVVRTWFYNDDILAWYPDFNKARTEFYAQRKIFDSLLPASTGIGSPNPSGKKISSGAFAIKSKLGKIAGAKDFVCELPSPLQGGATEYGSSFSRAVEITSESSKRIMISGTASIAPDGKTVHLGDIQKQVELTLAVIEGILKSRGMSFTDTVNAVVYCLRPEYFAEFEKWNKQNNIPFCPSYSIVCRDDLLFEIELEAAKNS